MKEGKSALKILTCKLQDKDFYEGLGVVGRTVLELILNK
jgi:hypothetical protein